MKKIIYLLLPFLFLACADESVKTFNSILILRVDYLTNNFEGGYKQTISGKITDSDTIPIVVDYQEPGDFGNISLRYQPTNDLLFDGSIIWHGTGKINYPNKFEPVDNFSFLKTGITKPDDSRFNLLFYELQQPVDYSVIWNSIGNISVLQDYLQSNKKIEVFLYTPSVGVGNPANWDWFIILNK